MVRKPCLAVIALITLTAGVLLAGPRYRVEYTTPTESTWVHTGEFESVEKAQELAARLQHRGCGVRITDLGAVPPGPHPDAAPTPEEDGPSAYGFRVRSTTLRNALGGLIEVKTDARIQGAKNRECEVRLVFCESNGGDLLTLYGERTIRIATVTPTSDSYLAEGLSYYIPVNLFRQEFGPTATTLTAYLVVVDKTTGKRLNTPNPRDVLRIDLRGKLPAAKPQPTDYPDRD